MARPEPDSSLVEEASRGDRVAVDALLERHLPGLRAYVKRRVGYPVAAREEPSDLVQSACREVLEHLDRFQYESDDGFRRWLYATALRKIQDRHRYWRAQRRDADREVELTPGSSGGGRAEALFRSLLTPSLHAVAQEQVERIDRAFQEIPERSREVLLLSRVDGLNHAEIAERVGITETHARVLLSRALARLAQELRVPGDSQG